MSLTRASRLRQLDDRLDGRSLVYFGTRGTDARPLLELRALSDVFCQIAPLHATSVREICLESETKRRVDLDRYSIDEDTSEPVRAVRAAMLRAFERPAAVMGYRPTALVASAWFPRSDRVLNLGVFHEQQSSFEHKPWVETQLAARGVRTLPWSYYSDDDLVLIREAAEQGPLVLRANRSDGGAGLTLIQDPSEMAERWPTHVDGFLAASRYLTPNVPLNVNACVFPGGHVSMHAASVQLIGIEGCTNRRFGYCGNDFALAQSLGPAVLRDLDEMTRKVGAWLAEYGYLGAFGIDALLHEDKVWLVELNPRFQGSSRIAAELDAAIDRPDMFLNHLAAFLRLPPPPHVPLQELTTAYPSRAHVVAHNLAASAALRTAANADAVPMRCSVVPAPGVAVDAEAVLFGAVFDQSISDNGATLHQGFPHQLESARAVLYH